MLGSYPMANDMKSEYPEPAYTHLMWRIAERRNRILESLRAEAVTRLKLSPGSRVIDAACGTGASFPFLLHIVGPTGEIVGVEISEFMAEIAKRHIRENGWGNVRVVISPAQTAQVEGDFDALLLFAAHEVLTSSQALDNLFAHLKPGARVAAFGARLRKPPLGWLTNPFFRLVSKKWLPHSPPIDWQPWRLLLNRCEGVEVEGRVGGVMYLVSGRKT